MKSWREGKTSSTARGYNSRWRKARLSFLKNNPLCIYCRKMSRVTPAEVVDHIQPHRGDPSLFWDRNNWQPLCKKCHDTIKKAQEHGRKVYTYTEQGEPVEISKKDR